MTLEPTLVLPAAGRLHDRHSELADALWGEVWLGWETGGPQNAECRLPGRRCAQVVERADAWHVAVSGGDPEALSWIEAALRAAFGDGPAVGPPPWFPPAPAARGELCGWINAITYRGAVWIKAGPRSELRGAVGADPQSLGAAFIADILLEYLPEDCPLQALERSRWLPDPDGASALLDGASHELGAASAALARLIPRPMIYGAVGDIRAALFADDDYLAMAFES